MSLDMPKSEKQQLIDIGFQMVAMVLDKKYHKNFVDMSLEEQMEWVSKQYKECGYETFPAGASWGVLKK
jgi:hypothetical protein